MNGGIQNILPSAPTNINN